MDLANKYEAYTQVKKGYLEYIEGLVESDFSGDQEAIQIRLKEVRVQLEELMGQIEEIEMTKENEDNLKDFKYLLVDILFLAMDLEDLYTHKDLGRFKLRVINYSNKQKYTEMFGRR